MSKNAKHIFNEAENRLCELNACLGHPARIKIITTIGLDKKLTCGDIVNILPYSQSTVSQHLLHLKSAGILQCESVGTKSLYSLNQDVLDEYVYRFNTLFKGLNNL